MVAYKKSHSRCCFKCRFGKFMSGCQILCKNPDSVFFKLLMTKKSICDSFKIDRVFSKWQKGDDA